MVEECYARLGVSVTGLTPLRCVGSEDPVGVVDCFIVSSQHAVHALVDEFGRGAPAPAVLGDTLVEPSRLAQPQYRVVESVHFSPAFFSASAAARTKSASTFASLQS